MADIRDPAQLGPTLLRAINEADLDAVVACYTLRATLELPDGTTVTGHDGIRAFYAALLASRRTSSRESRLRSWCMLTLP